MKHIRPLLVLAGLLTVAPSWGASKYLGVYNGRNQSASVNQLIGLVSSVDGSTWTRVSDIPIISTGAAGVDAGGAAQPSIVYVSGTYYVYYTGYPSSGSEQIMLATSSNGTTFTKQGVVLATGTAGDFDETHAFNPCVYYDSAEANAAKKWKMMYTGYSSNVGVTQIGYAYAANPLGPWTKSSANPVISYSLAVGHGWENGSVYSAAFTKEGSTFYFHYFAISGDDLSGNTGLATFTDPEGSITRFADPILSAQQGRISSLSSSSGIGATTVNVGNGSLFTVGEACLLYDTANAEAVRITAINSNAVTFTPAALAAYTTGRSAKLAGMSQFKVSISGIVHEGSTYRALVTAFGISSKQREFVISATASAIGGPWTFDFAGGFVLPPRAFNSNTWDMTSSENISFIQDPTYVAPSDSASKKNDGVSTMGLIGFGGEN